MYAAAFLPAFTLQAALRWQPELAAQPLIVVDSDTGLVLERTLTAAALEIFAGMSSPQAMARCPGLKVLTRSRESEEALSSLLQEVALSHSPLVEAAEDGAVIMDWRGLHHQIDWHTLGDHVVRDLQAVQARATVGLARTPDVALLAAREADPVSVVRDNSTYLHPLPIAFLHPPEDVQEILCDWGIVTVGDFLRLPKAETIERLGEPAQQMWRVAGGRSHRPLRLIAPPEVYAECHDFEYGIETTEPLLFLSRRFIDQLSARLQAKYLVASRLTLRLPLDGGEPYERAFTIPEPTAEADVMFRILSTHLDQLTLDHQPTGLRLFIEPAKPTRQQFGLFGAAIRDPNRFGETLARIGALVGSDKLGFPQIEDTHRPDRFRLRERVPWSLEMESPDDTKLLGLPLQRWRPPLRAEVEIREHCPWAVSSSAVSGRIVSVQGPYCLSGNWWEPGAWDTEEWDVQLNEGGIYRLARNGNDWRVEGCYDSVC